MNDTMTRKPGVLHITEKDQDLLGYICEKLCEKIKRRKPVYEKMIMDFSVLIARMIQTGSDSGLPSSFEKLADNLKEYWFYSAYREEDKELSFSYIRIYQDISMFRAFIESNRYEENIQNAVVRFRKYNKLLQAIYDNPELTHGNLAEILKLKVSNLSQRISSLIKEEYIYTTRVGKYKFYSLSNKGLELLNAISAKEGEESKSCLPQSIERKELIQKILELAMIKDHYISAKDVLEFQWPDYHLEKYDAEDGDGKKIIIKQRDNYSNPVYSDNDRYYQRMLNLIEEKNRDSISENGTDIYYNFTTR